MQFGQCWYKKKQGDYTITSLSIFVIVLRQREVNEDYFSNSQYTVCRACPTCCERDSFR